MISTSLGMITIIYYYHVSVVLAIVSLVNAFVPHKYLHFVSNDDEDNAQTVSGTMIGGRSVRVVDVVVSLVERQQVKYYVSQQTAHTCVDRSLSLSHVPLHTD